VSPRDRRRFYVAFGAFLFCLFVGGIAIAFVQRNKPICSDGRTPVAQRDAGLGQVSYRCHNGQVVTK